MLTIGIVAGFASGLFGIGGGIIMVPLLVLAAKLPQREASATSLAAIIPTASIAAVTYVSSDTVPWDQLAFGLIIAVGSAALAPIGSLALRRWNITVVRWVFITMLAVTAVMIFITVPDRGAHLEWSIQLVVQLIALGALMGFAAGLLGVGGGIIAVPILILMGVSDLTAKALSLVAMVPAAITGTTTSHRAGLVRWNTALPLAVTTTIAAPFGVWVSAGLSETWANPLLAACIFLAAVQLADRALRDSRKA